LLKAKIILFSNTELPLSDKIINLKLILLLNYAEVAGQEKRLIIFVKTSS